MSTILANFLTRVKNETKIDNTELDTMIQAIADEEILALSKRWNFHDLLVSQVALALTIVPTGISYGTLPSDFSRLVPDSVYYDAGGAGLPRKLKPKPSRSIPNSSFPPMYYTVGGGKLNIFPNQSMSSTDVVTIDYFQKPATIAASGSAFPVEEMVEYVFHAVVARLCLFDSDTGEMYSAHAELAKARFNEIISNRG